MKGLLIKGYRKITHCLKLRKSFYVEDMLQELYLPEDKEKLYEAHQMKKLGMVLLIVFIGLVSAVCAHLSSRMENKLTEGARLERNEWGAGNYSVVLQARDEENGWQKEMVLEVKERRLTEEEREEMFGQIEEMLPELIKGDNQDLLHVETDLKLITEVSNFPATISWVTGSKRIDRTGSVNRKGLLQSEERTEIVATVAYLDEQIKVTYPVCLLPEILSDEEEFFRNLNEEVTEADTEAAEESCFSLPASLDQQMIVWEEVQKSSAPWILLLTVFVALLAVKDADKDLERRRSEKQKQLLMAYPDFVSKLRLYLSAGITMKNTFFYLMKDYEKRVSKNTDFLCQELHLLCNRFENGVSEEKAYEEWGRRCADMSYRKLSLLLITNLRQGNRQMLHVLEAEEENAREQRKQQARKLGEEAGIKLLFPMLLQLLVVMFLILIPAYMDFGSVS